MREQWPISILPMIFAPGADQHAMADFWMAVAALLAGAAQRHAVQDRDVVLDHRCRADHEAGGVIEENALADPRGGLMSVWNTDDERLCR